MFQRVEDFGTGERRIFRLRRSVFELFALVHAAIVDFGKHPSAQSSGDERCAGAAPQLRTGARSELRTPHLRSGFLSLLDDLKNDGYVSIVAPEPETT